MATIKDNEDTIEAESLSTTLDPYGQLIKMLMPRALCIAIYEAMGMPLWSSEGYDGPDLLCTRISSLGPHHPCPAGAGP